MQSETDKNVGFMVYVEWLWRTFDLEQVKVIWGHSVHFYLNLENLKTAPNRGKGTKFWASESYGV